MNFYRIILRNHTEKVPPIHYIEEGNNLQATHFSSLLFVVILCLSIETT